jgi:hypothetical protein
MDEITYMIAGTAAIIGATAIAYNLQLFEDIGKAIKEHGRDKVRERLETGINWTLAPSVRLARKVYGI